MISIHPLLPKLRQLNLSGMLNTLDLRAEQAIQEQLSPLEFFALLLDDELERREQNRLAYRLTISGCNPTKTLSHFDFLSYSRGEPLLHHRPGDLRFHPAP